MNAEYLRSLGGEKLIGGEFEKELVAWANGAAGEENSSSMISLERLPFRYRIVWVCRQ